LTTRKTDLNEGIELLVTRGYRKAGSNQLILLVKKGVQRETKTWWIKDCDFNISTLAIFPGTERNLYLMNKGLRPIFIIPCIIW